MDEAGKEGSEAFVLAGGIKRWAENQKELTDPVLHFPG